jgi:2-polyprenyl-6-hydroxyphenyl methylase/3-demethylubiquinone-9 3-methyltransferase
MSADGAPGSVVCLKASDQQTTRSASSTVDAADVAQFDLSVTDWWDDPRSPARWLHRYNPVRLSFIRDAACRLFYRDPSAADYLHDLRVLEIGCGAGLLCEPLAQVGARVVGADAAKNAIHIAKLHAERTGVDIDYRHTTAEALREAGERFDVVLAMEVVEHVANSAVFLQLCAELVKPGGLMVLSTINRTWKSLAYAIVMAEYVLGLLPRGTHQWRRFVTPEEIRAAVEGNGLTVSKVSGVTMNILSRTLQLSADTGVNYMLAAERPGPQV